MSDPNTLFFSADGPAFYTLEGESVNAGRPSVFSRLSLCNLSCSGWATPENPLGCDSAISWRVKNKWTFDKLFEFFEQHSFHKRLQNGAIWKLTGGEPLIQQVALLEFVAAACERWDLNHDETRIEFETNGTILPLPEWRYSTRIPQAAFIVSPKLANNGDPTDKRFKPEVLRWHAESGSTFKFVVTSEQDVEDVRTVYAEQFAIEPWRIWLMPEGTTTAKLKERAPWVAEQCKRHGYNFSNRLHIFIWEQALRV